MQNEQYQIRADIQAEAKRIKAAMDLIDMERTLIFLRREADLVRLKQIKHQYNKLLFDLDLMGEL